MKSIFYKIPVLIFLLFLGNNIQAQIINTVAGIGGLFGYTGDGTAATGATLYQPWAVAVDTAGNMYIADAQNHVIRKVSTSGIITTVAGNGFSGFSGDGSAATSARLNYPQGVIVDSAGNLYIADDLNGRVRRVDAVSGNISTIAGGGASFPGDGGPATSASLPGVIGLAIDKKGNLYFSDGNYAIRKVDITGTITTYAGTVGTYGISLSPVVATAAQIALPAGLAIDNASNLYFAESGNNYIWKVDTFGNMSIVAGNGAYAGSGGFPPTGDFTGDGGLAVNASLNVPFGVATDNGGNLYIADQYNNVIRRVDASGIISTVAGDSAYSGVMSYNLNTGTYSGDGGPALGAGLNSPADVVIDHSGNLYIADAYNSIIRRTNAIVITASPGDTVCEGAPVTFTATSYLAGSATAYQWTKNGTNVGTNSSTYIADSVSNGDIIICKLLNSVGSTLIAASAGDTMTVHPSLSPAVSIVASVATPVCAGTIVSYTATPVNGGAAPAFQWRVNGVNMASGSTYVYVPANGDVVTCVLTSDVIGCVPTDTALSPAITMTVNPVVAPSVIISSVSTFTVCTGATVSYTATPVNGGTLPLFQWRVNGVDAVTGIYYTYTPVNGDIVTVVLTSNAACLSIDSAVSNVTMTTELALTPSVTIACAAGYTVCAGATVTYTATSVFGGVAPTYQWKKNGADVATGNTYSYMPANGDIITSVLTSDAGCLAVDTALSNAITMSVTPLVTPSFAITSSAPPVLCAGQLVSFSATGIANGGSAPTFQWRVNGFDSSTSVVYTYTPANGDIVSCILTSNAACAAPDTAISAAAAMTVTPVVVPLLNVTAGPGYLVCAGTAVSYTAAPTNGGIAPAYEWRVNGVNSGTGATYSYTPANGDLVSCLLSSNAACATPDTAVNPVIVMTVNPVITPSVTITSATGYTVCAGTSVTYTATPVNGGAAPSYQWKKNGVDAATGSTYTYTPTTGDLITCVLTSSASCLSIATAVSNTITMTVNPVVIPAVSVTGIAATVCSGVSVTYTATPVNGGTSPTYKWKVNGILSGTGPTHTYAPANGDIVTCVVTSNATCAVPDTAISAAITMTVIPTLVPSVSVTAAPGDVVCAGVSVTYTATPVNGGTSPTYNWKVNGISSASGASYTYTPAAGDHITCVLTSNAVCATPDTAISTVLTMTVNPIVTPSVSIAAATGYTVCAGSAVTYTATAVNGGASPSYQWIVNSVNEGTSATYTYTPVNGDMITCVLTSNAACASTATVTSTVVDMDVLPIETPSVTITSSGTTVATPGATISFTATVTNGGPSPTYQWVINGTAVPGATGGTFATDTFTTHDAVFCVVTAGPCSSVPFVNSDTIHITVTVAVPQVSSALTGIRLLPNPNSGSFTVVGSFDAGTTEVILEVTDMLGQVLYNNKAAVIQGKINAPVLLNNNLPNGMYLLHINSGTAARVLNFVIER